jgi:hypothetical protein
MKSHKKINKKPYKKTNKNRNKNLNKKTNKLKVKSHKKHHNANYKKQTRKTLKKMKTRKHVFKTNKKKTLKPKFPKSSYIRTKRLRSKVGGVSLDTVMNFFNNSPSQSSLSQDDKNNIVKMVESYGNRYGFSQDVQDSIIQNIKPNDSIESLENELKSLYSIESTPFIEINGESQNSNNEVFSFDDIATWGQQHPVIRMESIDFQQPLPLSESDLLQSFSETFTQEELTKISQEVHGESMDMDNEINYEEITRKVRMRLIREFFNKYNYNITEDELNLIISLHEMNFSELSYVLKSCLENRGLFDPSKIDVVLLVHGEVLIGEKQIDMGKFPNTVLNFAAPESTALDIEYFPSFPGYGRAYSVMINKAFDKKIFIFDKYGANLRKQMCPPMLMGISEMDDQASKDAFGYFIRLNDNRLIKLADFNSIYTYVDKTYGEQSVQGYQMTPSMVNMTLEYSLEFINKLCGLMSKFLNRDSQVPPLVNIIQLSCRSYQQHSTISPNIQKIWDALLKIGDFSDNVDYLTLKTGNQKSVIPSLSMPNEASYSVPFTVENIDDEEEKLDYIVEKIKLLADRIAILNFSNTPINELKSKKIDIIHEIIKYYRVINFEFAKRSLPVPVGASLIDSLTLVDSDFYDDNDENDYNSFNKDNNMEDPYYVPPQSDDDDNGYWPSDSKKRSYADNNLERTPNIDIQENKRKKNVPEYSIEKYLA